MTNIVLPIYWVNEKKTKKSTTHLCGMNFYRNAHYHIKNSMKKDIEEIALEQLKNIKPIGNQYTVHYKLYYKTKSCDGSNIIALMEKCFLDALQVNTAKEDNVLNHIGSSWEVAEMDKENPRCEIQIKEIPNGRTK